MSENEQPSTHTSIVPLKKETVRISLKRAGQAPAVPSATVPMSAPVKAPIPTGSLARITTVHVPTSVIPPAPTITAPSRPPTAGPPRPPAPTVPLRPAGAPTAMAPAPTIRLAAAAPTGAARPSSPVGSPTMSLPKATVQLQAPTQPIGTSMPMPQMATMHADDEDEVVENEGLAGILAGVGFAAALIVLAFQLMSADIWINSEDSPNKGQWSQLLSF